MEKYLASSYSMGHRIGFTKDEGWVYCDTNEKYDYNNRRPCLKCNLKPTKDHHDPCIANLEGVKNACCGHGVVHGYVQFENGIVIRGFFENNTVIGDEDNENQS